MSPSWMELCVLNHLGYGPDPLTSPLDYPGRIPADPAVLLLETAVLPVTPGGPHLGDWPATRSDGSRTTLDAALTGAGAAPMAARVPVAAVGSNASPAQLARKFTRAGLPPIVPITAVTIDGLAAGLSAHVSRVGYVPATPVPSPGARSPMHVTWLDPAQLAAMDATEPNYDRVLLPDAHAVTLPTGHPVPDPWIYVSHHGHVTAPDGTPHPLTAQPEVISYLISRLPALGVTTPQAWITAARTPTWRTRVHALMAATGLTHPHPPFGP